MVLVQMTKYIAYKIFEADGWSKEGQELIDSKAVDGFGVVHEDYVILSLQSELKQGIYANRERTVCSKKQTKGNKPKRSRV